MLSFLLREASKRGTISDIYITSRAPHISHLFFADDSLLFGSADVKECEGLAQVIHQYSTASGQRINFEKSSIIFSSNMKVADRGVFCHKLGVKEVLDWGKYLGMPSCAGRNGTVVFNPLKYKIWAKLNCWASQLLSIAGKEILIKVVAQAISTYYISCFKLPK